ACVGFPVIQVETQWAREPREYLDKGLALVAEHAGQPLLDFALAPHSMYTLDEDMLAEVSRVSEESGLRIHLHLLETGFEIEHALAHHDTQPLEFADRLGLLSDRLIAVHMAHLEDADIGLLAERGVHVVHCPQSNLKLASGTCRVSDLVSAGVNVCVGTDGAASNNDLDLLDELRTAALMAKGVSGDPCSVDAVTALDLVTVNAALALGIEDRVGSIEAGREADLCAVDLASVRTQPVHDVISQLVYAAAASQVSDVWVRGRRLLAEGELQTLDEARLLERVDDWSARVAHGRPRASRVAS
ncbi:MAG: amidohydrolase family protein, partial [Xanthomonadales bacterium]|nr:amidohydrolase family protein [Xanthomonadales bacterium]